MVRGRSDGLLIAGGGLAGGLAALALRLRRPDLSLLLVEEGERLGGGRDILFLDAELDQAGRDLIAPAIAARWPACYTAFPGGSRKIGGGISLLRADLLDAQLKGALGEAGYRVGARVVGAREDELLLQGGERIKALGAIDARGAANLSMLELGWRVSTARDYLMRAPHRVDLPVLADAMVEQEGSLRFFQCVPLSERRLLVEEICYVAAPEEDAAAAGRRIDAYLALRGWREEELSAESSAALPIAWGGDFDAFWRVGGARVAKLGLRGGFFHPATGSTLADAANAAALLASQQDLMGAQLHDLFESEAKRLWKRREPHRGVAQRLATGAPAARIAALADLFRQNAGFVGRFFAGEGGFADRIKISRLGR